MYTETSIIIENQSTSYIDENQILNQIVNRFDEQVKKNKIIKDRLLCDIKILELQLTNPLVSRSTKKNIRTWLELKHKQINELL